jgi:hypothetical protein
MKTSDEWGAKRRPGKMMMRGGGIDVFYHYKHYKREKTTIRTQGWMSAYYHMLNQHSVIPTLSTEQLLPKVIQHGWAACTLR